ncbi:MAG TPA: YCF48-related protein, partial [Pyrinomonadaceae bacterium]|nr:YCF48-related protein [Pyrinomonadaceae bacterium]
MIRYFAHRPIVSITVFAIACFGSVWLFKKQLPHPPLAVTNPLPLSVSTKFTKIGKVPTADGPRYELQFINEHEGWLAKRNHLWHTQDGGKTWELVHQLQHNSRQEFAQLQFINSKQGWAKFLNYGELYKTSDGGRTWIRLVTPMDDGYGSLWTFRLEPSGQSAWIAGGIFQPIKIGDPCMNNAMGSLPDSPYACLNGAVYRTTDGGVSWQMQKIPPDVGRFMSITVTGSDHVAVTGDAGMYYSNNSGRTWRRGEFRRECFDFYEFPDMYPTETVFVNDKIGWLSLSSGLIANTRDGGKTWCDLFFPESLWNEPGYVGPTQQFHSI